MDTEHKRHVLTKKKGLESKEGERRRLCSNNVNTRSPSLGFNPNEQDEDIALDYLADILVEIYLHEQSNRTNKT